MKTFSILFSMLIMLTTLNLEVSAQEAVFNPQDQYVLLIHGGAGTIRKESMTPEREAAYVAALKEALQAGYRELKAGHSSLDAVEKAIQVMEDSPLFNAGKGAVFTHEGKNELDASIMEGKELQAGAVAGLGTVRHPISAARAVMEKSEHVMLAGRGAEQFAEWAGLEIVDPKFFWTEARWEGLQKILQEDEHKTSLDHDESHSRLTVKNRDDKFGTVGCVALDQAGNLAAGTSTGGMTNKKFGRIGDAPLIGSGTYANNKSVAVSCTGWGEFFIRNQAAYDVAARMEYLGWDVEKASQFVIDKIADMGGDGGMIALDAKGKAALPFNTAGMYRGGVNKEGEVFVEIYR